MVGKCRECNFDAGILNLKNGVCKSCITKNPTLKMETSKNTTKPKQVETALMLMKIALGTMVLSLLITSSPLADIFGVSIWQVSFQNIFTIVFTWFFIYKAEQRHNWARVTMLVFTIFGFVMSFMTMGQTIELIDYGTVFLVSFLLGIGTTIMQTIALILLFQKPSSDWFKA